MINIPFTLLNIAAFVVGVIIGTQAAWYIQLALLALGWYGINKSAPHLEIAVLILLIPYVVFFVGLATGNISWLIQTGGDGMSLTSFFDLFIAK